VSAGPASPPVAGEAAPAHLPGAGPALGGQRASRIQGLIASMSSRAHAFGTLAVALAVAAGGACASTTRRDSANLDERAPRAGVVHVRWRTEIHPRGLFQAKPAECASGALAGDHLVIGSRAANVVGVRLADGHIDWATKVSGGVDSAARFDPARGQVFLGADDGTFYAVDANSGKVLASGEPALAYVIDAGLARGDERVHAGDRCGVVDDTLERVGQADETPQPAKRHGFELGGGGRGPPQHRLLIERRREKLGEHAGRAGGNREVREEAGMIPVGDRRQDQAIEVRDHAVEGLGVLRRFRRQGVAQLAWTVGGEHAVLADVLEVARDPLDEFVRVAPELVRRHVAVHTLILMRQ